MTIDDPRSMRERMRAGDAYRVDGELRSELLRAAALNKAFNDSDPCDSESQATILRKLLGDVGDGVYIRQPFYCDYGYQIRIGPRTFVNVGVTALDVAPITIGADVLIGPGAQLLTPMHPLAADARRKGWQSGLPITVGDTVWIGGAAVICPGVTIGDNAVIGAGAVVTRDVPAGSVVVGNPHRLLR